MTDIVDLEWIKANEALEMARAVYGGNPPYRAAKALAKRAHNGLIRTRARLFVWEENALGREKERNEAEWADLPRNFWWAEGHPALSQDWVAGDFSTWIRERFQWCAFGVEFCRQDIETMLPPPSEAKESVGSEAEKIDDGEATTGPRPTPADAVIAEKMLELIALGMNRDDAAKFIRNVVGFEQVGNEHARRVVAGKLPLGRPKKGA